MRNKFILKLKEGSYTRTQLKYLALFMTAKFDFPVLLYFCQKRKCDLPALSS